MPSADWTPRRRELLKKAAASLRDGESPFDLSWLSENEVTLCEAGHLAQDVADCIDIFFLATEG